MKRKKKIVIACVKKAEIPGRPVSELLKITANKLKKVAQRKTNK
jgi:hypothetical protein